MSVKKYCPVIFSIIFVLSFPVFASRIAIGGWDIITDVSGGIISMELSSPKTYLNTESNIEIFVDNQGIPIRGHVKFVNGVERDLNFPSEVMSFWNNFNATHAMWEYFASVNKIEVFNPDESPIPERMQGRMTRVIAKSGVEYTGKLIGGIANPDWFVLDREGTAITFFRHAVTAIQQLK